MCPHSGSLIIYCKRLHEPPIKLHCCMFAGLPELDEPGWTSDDFIRDFPVDFTLVLENVGDPDHGMLPAARGLTVLLLALQMY